MPSAGSLDRLRREQQTIPAPGPGEVRVRVAAIGLNFADVFACLGLYSATPQGPFVPGLECAGVVEEVGPPREHAGPDRAVADARMGESRQAAADEAGRPSANRPSVNLEPGTPVMVLTRFGGYATAVTVDARYVLPIPEGWSFAEAAAFPVQAITAWYGLVRLGEVERDEVVLVHSAAGGVGLHALRMAAACGARAIATVGHPDKAAFLERECGIRRDLVIVRDARRFASQLDGALGVIGERGLDLVLDAVLGPFFRPAWRRLRPEGRHVVFGAADFMPSGRRPNWLKLAAQYWRRPKVDPMATIDRNRSLLGFNLIWLFNHADRLPAAFAGARALAAGAAHIGLRVPFQELPAGLRALQSGRTVGKVVVEV